MMQQSNREFVSQDIEKQKAFVEIPLHGRQLARQSTVFLEQQERAKIRALFDEYDTSNDGYLSVKEMKKLIKDHGCDNLPKSAAKKILKIGDTNHDGKLSFDEFYILCAQREWLARTYAVQYCKLVVPRRNIRQDIDDLDESYVSNMSLCPPPLTMVLFSLIEIIFFIADVIYLEEFTQENSGRPIGITVNGPADQLFIYNPYKRAQAWRFLTYMFVHSGVIHLAMNLIIQIVLGVALELVHQWWRVAIVYLAGVFAGSMATSINAPNAFLAGASGGVYALVTAHVATIIMNWKEMAYASLQLLFFGVLCVIDVSSAYFEVEDPNNKIGYMAHLCGAIAGLLVGIGVLRNLDETKWEKKLWWLAVTIYFAFMLTGIGMHIFYPEYFLTPK